MWIANTERMVKRPQDMELYLILPNCHCVSDFYQIGLCVIFPDEFKDNPQKYLIRSGA